MAKDFTKRRVEKVFFWHLVNKYVTDAEEVTLNDEFEI